MVVMLSAPILETNDLVCVDYHAWSKKIVPRVAEAKNKHTTTTTTTDMHSRIELELEQASRPAKKRERTAR
jgi:hypothetical protein